MPKKKKNKQLSRLELIIESLPDMEFLKADGFDDCVIGFCGVTYRSIYSKSMIIQQLIADGLDYEDAIDHYGFNIEGAFVGEQTPIFCDDSYLN